MSDLPVEGTLAHPLRLDPFQRIVEVHWDTAGTLIIECVSLGVNIDNPQPGGDSFHHFPAPEIVQGVGGRIDLQDHRGEPFIQPPLFPIGRFVQEDEIHPITVDYAQIYHLEDGTVEPGGKARFISTISGLVGYAPLLDLSSSVAVFPLVTHRFPDGNAVQFHGEPEIKTVWALYADDYGKPIDPSIDPFGSWFHHVILDSQVADFNWGASPFGELVWFRRRTVPRHEATIFRQVFVIDFAAVDPAEFFGRLPQPLRAIPFDGGFPPTLVSRKYEKGVRFVDIDSVGRATVRRADETPATITRETTRTGAGLRLFGPGGFLT